MAVPERCPVCRYRLEGRTRCFNCGTAVEDTDARTPGAALDAPLAPRGRPDDGAGRFGEHARFAYTPTQQPADAPPDAAAREPRQNPFARAFDLLRDGVDTLAPSLERLRPANRDADAGATGNAGNRTPDPNDGASRRDASVSNAGASNAGTPTVNAPIANGPNVSAADAGAASGAGQAGASPAPAAAPPISVASPPLTPGAADMAGVAAVAGAVGVVGAAGAFGVAGVVGIAGPAAPTAPRIQPPAAPTPTPPPGVRRSGPTGAHTDRADAASTEQARRSAAPRDPATAWSDLARSQTQTDVAARALERLQRQDEAPPAQSAPGAKTLLDLTESLDLAEENWPFFSKEEIRSEAERLRTARLLLVTSGRPEIAKAAVTMLVPALALSEQTARFLDFRYVPHGRLLFSELLTSADSLTHDHLVVIDAASQSAQPFLDTLLTDGYYGGSSRRKQLERRRLMLVCVAPPDMYLTIGADPRNRPCHWSVSFLPHLLRPIYGEKTSAMRARLLEQQRGRRWSADEAEFYQQVHECIERGQLDDVIARGGYVSAFVPSVSLSAAAAAPTDRHGAPRPVTRRVTGEKPVHAAVQFAAAFFDRLSASELDRVVTTLLGTQTLTVVSTTTQTAADGTTTTHQASTEKLLRDIWYERADAIRRESELVESAVSSTTVANGAPDAAAGANPAASAAETSVADSATGAAGTARADTLPDSERRQALRHEFLDQHPQRVLRSFRAMHDAGLLFDGSERIADHLVTMTLDMMQSDPAFDIDWLQPLIERGIAARASDDRGIARAAQLLRALLARPELAPCVASLFERLMAAGSHATVLALIRPLRFAQGFDDLRWLQQVIDRGSADSRGAAVSFLGDELRRLEPHVQPMLRQVAAWLPPASGDAPMPASAVVALWLIRQYVIDATERIPAADYGIWPSRFPPFAHATRAEAATAIGELVAWLCHPRLGSALLPPEDPQTMVRVLAEIVGEWCFIACGPSATLSDDAGSAPTGAASVFQRSTSDKSASAESTSNASASANEAITDGAADATVVSAPPDARFIVDTLLGAVLAQTQGRGGRETRRLMLAHWEQLKTVFAQIMELCDRGERTLRAELLWRRHLVRAIALRFRILQDGPSQPAAH